MRHDPEIQRAVNSYELGLPTVPIAGRTGELLGRGTGSSLEFQEYRDYMPGDDIRHLDWGAYARSDTLMVRLYREEVSPRTEILLDTSASMSTGSGMKARLARQLAAMFSLLAGTLGGRPRVLLLGDEVPVRRLGLEGLDQLEQLPMSAHASMVDLLEQHAVPLSKQAVRIVISDFLFPHDPASVIRRLAGEASCLWVLQLLNEFEADPGTLGGRRLVDVETGGESDLMINRRTITEYLKRLKNLQDELSKNCRRAHATFVTLVAERGLPALCRDELIHAEVLRAV
jgi:uncharacterized protein (DUF58 family)